MRQTDAGETSLIDLSRANSIRSEAATSFQSKRNRFQSQRVGYLMNEKNAEGGRVMKRQRADSSVAGGKRNCLLAGHINMSCCVHLCSSTTNNGESETAVR